MHTGVRNAQFAPPLSPVEIADQAPTSARLRLEPLERRDAPANNIGQGLTSDFTDPDNWSLNRAPLVFGGDVSPMSTTLSYPPASGGGGGGGFGGTSTVQMGDAGLRLIDGDCGAVTLPGNDTFGEFEQQAGRIAQPNSATEHLAVTGSFKWTGGILDDTSDTAR